MSKFEEAKKIGLVLPQDEGTSAAELAKSDPQRAKMLAEFIKANTRQLVSEIASEI